MVWVLDNIGKRVDDGIEETHTIRQNFHLVFAEWFGQRKDAMIGMHIRDILGPEVFADNEPQIQAALRGEAQCFEQKITKPDGAIGYILIRYLPDLEGNIINGFVALSTDITEARLAKMALQVSESHFHLLADATFEGIAISQQGFISASNTQLANILGYTCDEMQGKPITLFIPAEEQERVMRSILMGAESRLEHDVICKNGRRIRVKSHGISLKHDKENLRITAIRDITSSIQAQRALQMAQARFECLRQANVIGVSVTDMHGTVIDTNDYYLKRLGYTRSEYNAGMVNWKKATPPEWLPADDAAVIQLRTTGTCIPYEKEYQHPDGKRVPVLIAIALLPGPEEHCVVIIQDLSDYKKAQLELSQANSELNVRTRQAEEASAAKSQFLSTVSHELRTPLHAILGYLTLLKRKSTGETLRQLSLIERSGVSLLNLINDLLMFNKGIDPAVELQADELELKILTDQIEHFGCLTARNENNRFLLKQSPDLPQVVWADEERLLQILKNLIDNACKFTRNGEVTLWIERITYDDSLIDKNSCRLRFAVLDTGIGIAQADLERIFEPLQRTTISHKFPGLGLGLSIARQWVKTLGGDLTVASTLGRGSEFSFTLELPIIPTPLLTKPAPTSINCDAFKNKLPKDEWEHFTQLLELGLIVRIEAWAKLLAERDTQYMALADRIVMYCQDANLVELSILANSLTPNPDP